ncbi:MAG TPA: SH3 domain-containing protein [Tepidisphaeraceae bacterium]|jgi:hypothetical protein|nr:SH3 domain-containing protein [Tepidisphaeraceae bacterium]
MAIRRFLLAAAVSFPLAAFALPAHVRAEDAPPGAGDADSARHKFIGVINGLSVFVRSSPREDAYPVMRLDKGQQVTVVGIKFKWLKILPPEGSFAYVPKAYVNLRGDGKVGRATREVIAKVGSTLNQLKTAPMAKIEDGQDVEILGEQDDYYKVKPPEGTYLYVNESFVDPLQGQPVAEAKPAKPKPERTARAKPEVPPAGAPGNAVKPAAPEAGNAVAVGPKTEIPSVTPDGAAPTTQPVDAVAVDSQELFNKLEADFKAANEKPITDQPIDALMTGYTDLLKLNTLTPRMREIGEVRVSTLDLRTKAKAEFLALRGTQVQAADRQKALSAERDEIQQRIKEKEVHFYAAVGTLRASSIQRGGGTLFRLTDPSTGRTVAYVRSSDASYATMLGQFVGVKGTLTTDTALNMKIIEQPTSAEPVDPSKVNDSVAAQIIPPSLMPRVPTARASD